MSDLARRLLRVFRIVFLGVMAVCVVPFAAAQAIIFAFERFGVAVAVVVSILALATLLGLIAACGSDD